MRTTDELDFKTLLQMSREPLTDGDIRSQGRQELVRRYLALVQPIARHFAHTRPDLVDDLIQVGSIGLLRAVERFNPMMGKTFESYANTLIAGEMRHFLRDHVPLVRPPRELVELRSKVLAAQAYLNQDRDTAVGAEAIAHLIQVPAEKVAEVLVLEENFAPASLDQELETEGGSYHHQLVDNQYISFQLATEDRLMLNQALAVIRSGSREVIEFAFYDDLTQTEIAKKLGISQMQVSRRLKSALGELWKVFNTKIF